MQNEVYADLLFLVNFSMDFLCFYLCARLLHRPLSLWRGILASAAGGVYAVTVLLWEAGRVTSFLIDIAVCFLLCAIAMGGRRERPRALLRLTGLYLLVSSLLGGVMTVLFSRLNAIPGIRDGVAEEGLSAWLFLGMAVLSTLLSCLWGRGFRRAVAKREVTVIVEHEGRRAELNGIVDSGNLLRDPIGGRVVIPTGAEQLCGVAPSLLVRAAISPRVSKAVEQLPEKLVRQIRLIPAYGATGECLLIGWVPDHVYVRDESEGLEREVSALIAPSRRLGRRGGVAALVPSELMLI